MTCEICHYRHPTLLHISEKDVIPVSKENVISSKDLEKWPYLRNVDIKEIDADVELLIGVNTPKAMEPWEIINSIGNGPYAVRTMLGWIVNGPLGSMGDVTNHHVVTTNRISVSEIEELLIKQYNQEFPETHYTEKREMSLDDKKFMKILTEQVTYENSHYYLPLPFRNDNVMMLNNREVAIRRAASLAKRLKGDKSYKQFMDKMLEQDYAEKIPLDQLHVVEGKIWYVPHHGVYHRRKGTLRVVFDCTSSFQNTSLNKELLQGPDLTNNLLGVLMRFRQGHIALMADIQAVFHQVRVHRKHVDFLRFLWWPDGDFEKQPEDYRMKVHLFGAISSPSCANFALQKTAQDNQHNYDKEVIETIQNNFYVDDCLKTADTETHATKLHKGLSDLCSTGGFKLTKWVSNSKKVLEVIPENERADMTWLQDTEHLSGLRINRCMKPKGFGTVISAQLHHFCDASEVGYGTVSYIRFASDRNVHVSFVVGKARVAPLKQMTIPRLELQAATLASRMDKMLRVELQMNLEPSVIWTESQSVLKDINNEQTRFSTFVTNRLTVIRDLTTKEQWRYVGSANNPADAASRGVRAVSLMSKHWWTGPDFLRREETHWPIIGKLMSTDLKDLEVRNVQVHWTTVTDNPTIKFLEYYSQWNHFKRALAWFLRLKDILKTKIQGKDAVKINSAQNVGSQCLSVDELERAENAVISYVQNSSFHEEVEALQKGKQVKLTSNISSLDPILENGILRVGGRFNKMAMPISQQHPAILPKNSHISRLIMRHIHQTLGHSGRNHVLSKLRQHYWIPSANSLARRTIKECVLCRRLQGKAGEQKMADLPAERITPDLPPFTHVGIDYFGPIEVKKGRGTAKRYGVIFTCLVSRAIHLEVANSLDTDACINALRRFICRRGPVATIRTDLGTNFIGSHRELDNSLKNVDHEKIHETLTKDGIKWMFNPPFAPHHGGVWERLIKSLKKILHSLFREQILDDDGLLTALCEVETIMNDRPLTTVSDDPLDLEHLTPNKSTKNESSTSHTTWDLSEH
ncbi:hypothetical protein SRHO_G00339360 [Serrasalmus rhombeus]